MPNKSQIPKKTSWVVHHKNSVEEDHNQTIAQLLITVNTLIDWAHGVEERLPEKKKGVVETYREIVESRKQPHSESPGGGGQDYVCGAGGKQEVVYTEMPKETKPPRWRAEKGEEYWFVDSDGQIVSSTDLGSSISDFRYNTGNYFFTEKEAKQYRESLLSKHK